MRAKGILRWLTMVWFVALLAGPGVWSVAKGLPASVANRAVREFPTVDVEGLWYGDVFAEIDGHLQDRLATRDRAVETYARLSYGVLHDSTHADVLVGDGEWLYYRPVFERPCQDKALGEWPDPDELVASLDAAAERMAAVGVDFHVTRIAEKGWIETENLPDSVPGAECSKTLQDEMRAAFATTDISIDLWTPFEQATLPDRPLFWPRDTHWTDRGRTLAVQTLVEGMAPGVWDGVPVEGPDRRIIGELALLLGLDSRHASTRVTVSRPEITSQLTRPDRWIRCWESGGDAPLVPGRTVIVTDSHLWRSDEELAPWFEQLCVVNWAGATTDEVMTLTARADHILLSLTARETGQLAGWANRLADWRTS